MRLHKHLALLMVMVMALSVFLTGCGENTVEEDQKEKLTDSSVQTEVTVVFSEDEEEKAGLPSFDAEAWLEELGLSEQQRNSFSMLYHLAITAEEIRSSKDNRLMLDDINTSLLNDINPGAVDDTTQDHLKNLRDIIARYSTLEDKRERLQYVHNQDKATALRSAVPNPLMVFNLSNATDWKRLAISTGFTVMDSYAAYKNAAIHADQTFLLSGWELDDEEMTAVRDNRDRAFDYMVDMVQEHGLDGRLTLSEQAIETFVEICRIDVVQQKIRRLESAEETYKLLGKYWLELADCYFETEQYEKCLLCIFKYDALSTGIYRKDYSYALILPKAIAAAQEVCSEETYVATIEAFADAILENTADEDWAARYFAAHTYMDLYERTEDREYMVKAYNIVYDNVAVLVDEQRAINAAYLADVQELFIEEPKYDYMTDDEKKAAEKVYREEKKRLQNYNKAAKVARKTELPALYEPLVLNCELLIALAERLEITQIERTEIEAILQTDINGVFLTKPVNDCYSFREKTEEYCVDFDGKDIVIPAYLLTADAEITVKVTGDGPTVTFEDCVVKKVEREEEAFDSFVAYVTSKQMKKYEWTEKSKVTVSISNGQNMDVMSFRFKVAEYKDNRVFADKVVFEAE